MVEVSGCQGFLPHMPDEDDELGDQHANGGANQEIALEDLDVEPRKSTPKIKSTTSVT